MKKITLILLTLIFAFPIFSQDFSFNGIPFGSKQGSFREEKKIKIAELKFSDIEYKYENGILVEVSAELDGGQNSMKRLSDFISILQEKYCMKKDIYMQNGGDIINLYDNNLNTITIIISSVDNEDCEAKLNEAKILFSSKFYSVNKDFYKF